jgi:hypothetical protein
VLSVVRRRPGFMEKSTEIVRGRAARLPWAWDGLCFAVAMQEPSNEGLRDVVTGNLPTSILGQTWVDDDRGNPACKFTNVDPCYVDWPDSPTNDKPTRELTVYMRMYNQGTAVAFGGALCNIYSTVSPYMTWSMRAAGATPDVRIETLLTLGGNNYFSGDSGSVPTGFYHAFLRWRQNDWIYFTALDARGTQITQVLGSTTDAPLDYAAGKGIRLNASDNTNNNYDGIYSQALVWSRRLQDAELQALALDPFGWYAPGNVTASIANPFLFVGAPNVLGASAGPENVSVAGPYAAGVSPSQFF